MWWFVGREWSIAVATADRGADIESAVRSAVAPGAEIDREECPFVRLDPLVPALIPTATNGTPHAPPNGSAPAAAPPASKAGSTSSMSKNQLRRMKLKARKQEQKARGGAGAGTDTETEAETDAGMSESDAEVRARWAVGGDGKRRD